MCKITASKYQNYVEIVLKIDNNNERGKVLRNDLEVRTAVWL
jgi:hypothetical protein